MCVRPRVVSLTQESQDKNLAWHFHWCSRRCSTASRRWQHSVVLQLSPSRPEQRAWHGSEDLDGFSTDFLKGSKDNCLHWNRTGLFSKKRLAYWIPGNPSLTPSSTLFHSSYFSNSKPNWFNFLFTQATEMRHWPSIYEPWQMALLINLHASLSRDVLPALLRHSCGKRALWQLRRWSNGDALNSEGEKKPFSHSIKRRLRRRGE